MTVHLKRGINKIVYNFKLTNNLECLNFNLKHSWSRDGLDVTSSTQWVLSEPEIIILAICYLQDTLSYNVKKHLLATWKRSTKTMLIKIMGMMNLQGLHNVLNLTFS